MSEQQPASESDEQEISLAKLSRAFAGLMSNAPDAPQSKEPAQQQVPVETAEPNSRTEDTCEEESESLDVTPRSILEAILFVGIPDNTPLSSKKIAARLRGVSPREVEELVVELNRSYGEEKCPYTIQNEGSGYRMVLREQFSALRDKFHGRVRQARLSQAAIDVLAIVAYNQPATREDVEKIRETPSGAILTQLVRRKLLRFDRSEENRRIRLYYTTDRFLQLFGLTSLEDLPQSQELGAS